MKAIILAAGVGSRLGESFPKSLIKIDNDTSILENQIMERFSAVLYKYNPYFHVTNTSQSLLLTLESIDASEVIWINGDVYLEKEVVWKIIKTDGNVVGVNSYECGQEKVKYKTSNGFVTDISKFVMNAEGEAVGINKISEQDFNLFVESLREIVNQTIILKREWNIQLNVMCSGLLPIFQIIIALKLILWRIMRK